ncbi:hypothetical protein EVG20_g8248 [Dentipellis fragilis]|uniref:Phospholipase D/nuclease n=1 Tax=Dentipellis fragilis TaxID=205917 RepID=A0A4Y9Y6Q3_9AGAM|nr:hypothetical protein EVG20_g8248 [Dentipellis fragilis]
MSEDDDVARAIALSLQDSAVTTQAPPHRFAAVNDDPDAQFEADLQRAIEASRSTASSSSRTPRSRSPDVLELSDSDDERAVPSRDTNNVPSVPAASAPAPSASTFLSERAQLEQARLARLKRLRPDHEDADSAQGAPQLADERPRKRPTPLPAVPALSSSTSAAKGKGMEIDESAFWDGELRQTACKYVDKGKNGEDGRPVWRLTEIIGDKEQISQAVVSSFAVQIDWIHGFFSPNTPVVLIAHPAQTEAGSATVKEIRPNLIRVTPFIRGGYGCQHMKFMLIFYKSGRLRIVISTANMVDYDWRDIENSAWVQDVPRRPAPITHDAKAKDFPTTFERVLKCLNVAPALASFLHHGHPGLPLQAIHPGVLRTHWDFSRVRAHLVASIAGKHEGWANVLNVGHTALMRAVREIGAEVKKGNNVTVEYQGSSIGTYSTQWLNEFYTSASGTSPEDWLDTPKARRTKLPWPNVRIVYPTLEWVRATKLGERGGGTLFCRRKQWEGAKFPRQLFVQSKSKRGGVLMHTKMIIATIRRANAASGSDSGAETDQSDDELIVENSPGKRIVGWTYVGSHNFTPSAWGTLSGSGFTPVMNITNYELGIVLPLHSEADVERVSCFERPARKYGKGDLPWMQEESQILAMDE